MSEEQTKQNVSLEETFEEIETIIKQLENPEVTLDDSFQLYQAGVEKLKNCNVLLDAVEKKMQVIQADGSLADFE
mgnify:FL=1|jgi:exodeoxyribonuclease VII small subunit